MNNDKRNKNKNKEKSKKKKVNVKCDMHGMDNTSVWHDGKEVEEKTHKTPDKFRQQQE